MKAVGIICEYNPFHNGHLYHIKKIKEMFSEHIIILVMSGPFTQRGEASILTKREKTEIALTYEIDLVIELPFIFATSSADLFAYGAITILKELKVEYLVFGSEENNIDHLTTLASIQLEDSFFQKVQKEINTGINYPTALSRALKQTVGFTVSSPNDLLGVAYIKEILKQQASITPISIKRTNDYHSICLHDSIVSANAIRTSLKRKEDISNFVPKETFLKIHSNIDMEEFFPLLKYKIISEKEQLFRYHEVSPNMIPRIQKNILTCESLDELIQKTKSKCETYQKLKRMYLYILCGITKDEAHFYQQHPYIRILGFQKRGKQYLNQIKKEVSLPFFTNYSNDKNHLLHLEFKVHQIYTLLFPQNIQTNLLNEEIKNFPILK